MGRKKRKAENNDPSSLSNPSAVDAVVAVGQNAPILSGAMIKTEAPVAPPPHHPHPAIIAPDAATAATNISFPPPFMAAVDPRRVPAVDPRAATMAARDPRASTMATRDPRFPPPPPTAAAVKEEPAQLAQLAQPTAAPSTATATSTAARIKSATMIHASTLAKKEADLVNDDEADLGTKPSSMYGLHSHSGDIVEEDIYVSSGSDESDDEDEEEEENDQKEVVDDDGEGGTKKDDEAEKSTRMKTKKEATNNLLQKSNNNGKNNSPELVISTSKMGLMRRGGISSLLGGTTMHRQWVRGDAATLKNEQGGDPSYAQVMQQSDQMNSEQQQNDEETITDPALLLAIQQRKIEQAKIQARIIESSENAGRDPCLFSKRTAFDIRMDQIEDKPWDKGPANAPNGLPNSGGMDITDYFNYGLTEEDWMEYAERQLAVRQELTDASKQKRLPDPAIVPVVPRAPSKQGDRVAVRVKKAEEGKDGGGSIDTDGRRGDDNDSEEDDESEAGVEVGPVKPAELEEKNKEGGAGGNDDGATTVDSISDKDDGKFDEGVKKDDVKSETTDPEYNPEKIVGGAWGAGAAPDSVLLRLIQEQSGGGLATGIGLGMGMGMGMGMAGPPGMMAGMHNNMGMTMNVNLNMPPPGMGVSGMGIPPPPPPPPPPKNVPPPPPPKQDKDSHTSAADSGHGHHGHHHPGGNINGGNMDWDQGSQNGGDGFHDRRGHGGSRGGDRVGEDRHPHHPHNKFNRQGSNTNSDGRDNRDVGSASRGGGHNFPPPPHQHSRHQDYRQQQHQQHDQDPYNNGRQAQYQQQQRPPHPHHRRGGMEGDRRSERGGSTGGGGGEGFSPDPFAGRHPPNGPPQVPGGGGHGGGMYGQYPPNSYNDRRGGGGRGDGRDHRGRGPPPGRGGHPHGPPPHGWDGGGGRKRSRNDYGDPRGDQRRGRW